MVSGMWLPSKRVALLALFPVASLASPTLAQGADCRALLPHNSAPGSATRATKPEDLVRLRDIGSLPDFREPVVSVSPDRKWLAFEVRQANLDANDYCRAMVAMPARLGGKAVMIDTGGEAIRWRFPELPGKADFPSGFAKVITPRWLPDSKSIAFLKRAGTATQIWRARVDGSGSEPITHSDTDILDFRIAKDGRTIVFSSSPALASAWQEIEHEGLSGFHYDDRYAPNASSRPFPKPPVATQSFALDVATRLVRPATRAEAALLEDDKPRGSRDAISVAVSPTGRRAWTMPSASDRFPPSAQLVAVDRAGEPHTCPAQACRSVTTLLGWSEDGERVRFTHLEGWARSKTAIYEWRPGSADAKRLYVTQDLLVDCRALRDDIVCVEESSTAPRRISLVNLAAGTSEVLFDPNPEFSHLSLGRVERLNWKSAYGTESFGDLVYPVGYQPGHRYPLIVVQYVTRGFLRGGTGDEYPIQAFANRGYAVLSIERPRSPVDAPDARSYADLDKADLAGFKDRKNVLSAIELAVKELVKRGLVDPDRIGITGLSDGSSTVQFAGLNSDVFSAAAMSSCCWAPAQMALLGPAVARQYAQTGWPLLTDAAPGFWRNISWDQQPGRVAFPVLMQLPDSEFRSALASYTALKEAGSPVDMYVYPGEAHVKWQPAHRLAIYRRNLDWFDFWLKGSAPDAPPAEILRWTAMRQESRDKQPTAGTAKSTKGPPARQ